MKTIPPINARVRSIADGFSNQFGTVIIHNGLTEESREIDKKLLKDCVLIEWDDRIVELQFADNQTWIDREWVNIEFLTLI